MGELRLGNRVRWVRPGDVVFHSGRGLLSDAIRRVTGCPWSHVSMVMEVNPAAETFSVLDVLETRVIQCVTRHDRDLAWHVRSPRYPRPHATWCEPLNRHGPGCEPRDVTRRHVVKHALEIHETVPASYPYLELAAYLPGLRRTALGRRILNRTDRLVCSATVAAAWFGMGFRWYDDGGREISPDWVDPGTMFRQANWPGNVWPLVLTKEAYDA